MAFSLLEEQSLLAAKILAGVEASVESQLALAGELASRAEADGQRHLVQYLERVIDGRRRMLGFVQGVRAGN